MARHNRDAHGTDQRGYDYEISYQPDWVRQIKVTRPLESGRQSTKTLFKNPAAQKEQSPGPRTRTRIACKEQNFAFEIEIDDPDGVVTRVIVVTQAQKKSPPGVMALEGDGEEGDEIEFTIEERLPPPPWP